MPSDRRYSRVVPRPTPSAMLVGIELAARRAWTRSPNCSDGGRPSVNRYTSTARSIPRCQTMRSRKERTGVRTEAVKAFTVGRGLPEHGASQLIAITFFLRFMDLLTRAHHPLPPAH